MNMLFCGTLLIIAGIVLVFGGISSELNNRVKIKKGQVFVTIDEGVSLKRYTLNDASFGDGTCGPVYIVGYEDKKEDK